MLKSQFVSSFAAVRMTYEAYAEWPSGKYEWMRAKPEMFVPYVDYALAGLKRFGKPVNQKTLSDQFGYVISEWWLGHITRNGEGRIIKVKYDVDRKNLSRLNSEAAKEFLPKSEPFCPYPNGGYCDLGKCEGACCEFHPDYKKPEAEEQELLHFEFIYDYEDSYDDGSVWSGSIREDKVCTREEADDYYSFLRECGYTNVSIFCQEDEM